MGVSLCVRDALSRDWEMLCIRKHRCGACGVYLGRFFCWILVDGVLGEGVKGFGYGIGFAG